MTQSFLLTPRGADWLRNLFAAKAAQDGGVIRRKRTDVDRMVGRRAFIAEMRRRGFGVVENGNQYVIFCNREELRRLA